MRLELRRPWGAPTPSALGGDVTLDASDRLTLDWNLTLPATPRVPGDMPGYLDGLWGYDVIELFVTASPPRARPRYVELEAGPGGHWLALAFDGVRKRSAELHDLAPRISQRVVGTRWTGRLECDGAVIARHAGPPPWRGLACLVAGGARGTERVHLTSAPLPGDAPDFHQPEHWPPLA